MEKRASKLIGIAKTTANINDRSFHWALFMNCKFVLNQIHVCMINIKDNPVIRFKFIYVIIMDIFKLYISNIILIIIALFFTSDCCPYTSRQVMRLEPIIVYAEESKCSYISELKTYVISIPERSSIIVASDTCELLSGESIRLTLDVFYRDFKKTFGDPHNKVGKGLRQLLIHLDKDPKKVKNVYDTAGTKLKESGVNGLFFEPNTIWIHVVPGSIVPETALVHELMHYSLMLSNGTPDADHEGKEFKGWTKSHTRFISTLNFKLRKLLSPNGS